MTATACLRRNGPQTTRAAEPLTVYTRCKGCHTVHPVNAWLLAQGNGKYRCGKCKTSGNALESLFDEWPAAGTRPPPSGQTPVLGLPIDLQEAEKSRLNPEESSTPGDGTEESPQTGRSGKIWLRTVWITAAIALAVITTFKLAEFYEQPLLEQPAVQTAIVRLGIKDAPAKQAFRDVSQIHLVSRELRTHPSRSAMLQLTATIVNRAPQAQPYPELEVILLDAAGQSISEARFAPADYLAEDAPDDSGMTPQAYLPLALDLPDPGNAAVGFELNFL